jgi:hypothetical protein
MKWSVFLLCITVCTLLFLTSVTSAVCSGGTTIFVPTPPPPPGPDGTISVESSPPGANIYLNGQAQGRSPVTIPNLWPGNYEITAEMSGFETFRTVTTISGPTLSAIYCKLTPTMSGNGLVIMSTPDKATVFLDGAEKGVTPIAISNPAAGSHTIQLRLSGYDTWESSVDILGSSPRIVSATLTEKAINTDQGINVSSSPPGASVILDGLAKGFTPISLYSIAAGIHILELESPGYSSWKSTIDVPDTGIKEIAVNLGPKPASSTGWITVSSGPGNASVSVDGQYAGRTPVTGSATLDPVTPGDHTIMLELTGYKPYTTQVSVSPNMTSSLNAVLAPTSARGTLMVSTDPAGADIFVDNKSVGTSPLTAPDIAAGYHMVTIKKEGFRDNASSFHIAAGETSTVTVTLLPAGQALHSPLDLVTVLGALGILGILFLRKPE